MEMEHFTYIEVTKPSENPHKRKYLFLIALFTFSAICMFTAGMILLIRQSTIDDHDGFIDPVVESNQKIIDLDQYCEEVSECIKFFTLIVMDIGKCWVCGKR